jgi:hypothetical protein
VNLSSIRVKLEQELSVYAADFEEASKELKVIIHEWPNYLFCTAIEMFIYYVDE